MSILGAHLELSSIVFVCSALPSVLQRNESESSEKSWAGCRKNHCKYEKECIYFKIGKGGGEKAESLWAFAWCARLTEVSQLTSQNFLYEYSDLNQSQDTAWSYCSFFYGGDFQSIRNNWKDWVKKGEVIMRPRKWLKFVCQNFSISCTIKFTGNYLMWQDANIIFAMKSDFIICTWAPYLLLEKECVLVPRKNKGSECRSGIQL